MGGRDGIYVQEPPTFRSVLAAKINASVHIASGAVFVRRGSPWEDAGVKVLIPLALPVNAGGLAEQKVIG